MEEELHNIRDNYTKTVNKAYEDLESHFLRKLQQRCEQCAVECVNRARDKVNPESPSSLVNKAQREAVDCTKRCVDDSLNNALPALIKRLQSSIQQIPTEQL